MHLIAGTNTYESLIHALRDKLEKMSEMVNHLCLRKVIDKMSGVQNGLKWLMTLVTQPMLQRRPNQTELRLMVSKSILMYRISANSCRDNYSFFGLWVRQLFKGDNYSKEETINFYLFRVVYNVHT